MLPHGDQAPHRELGKVVKRFLPHFPCATIRYGNSISDVRPLSEQEATPQNISLI